MKPVADGRAEISLAVLKNDADADRDPLAIVTIEQPAHGVATLNFETQKITYTAEAGPVQNDAFTYTIADGSGGRATAQVIVRTSAAGRYQGTITRPNYAAGETTGPEVGSLEVKLKENRTLTGRVSIDGKVYRFTGRFNEWSEYATVLSTQARRSVQMRLRRVEDAWKLEVTLTDRSDYLAVDPSLVVEEP